MADMHRLKILAVLCESLLTISVPALAGERVALVIGNASYAHAPRLANPGY